MGQGFRFEIDNQSGYVFKGTAIHSQCMYNAGNLSTLEMGLNQVNLEFNAGGNCSLANRYIYQGFSLPGDEPYSYWFVFALLSRGAPRPNLGPQWFWAEIEWEGRTAMLGIQRHGIKPHFTSQFKACGDDACLSWAVDDKDFKAAGGLYVPPELHGPRESDAEGGGQP
jgi:hypothetical protein